MSKTVLVVGSMASAMLLASMVAVLTAVPSIGQSQTVTLVGAGDIAECSPDNNAKATAALLNNIPGTVLALGDNAYPHGTPKHYANCYDNYRISDGSVFDAKRTHWWGQYKARTMPILGNHDYHSSKIAQPYFDYFSANRAVGFKQPPAPVPNTTANPGLTPGKGYYSYDRGSWHIVALNSNCNKVGGCEKTSTQGKWLRNNLANTNKLCTLAYFHHPLYSTGNNVTNPNVKPLWQILYNHHADVILNGHAHRYERFAPLTPGGKKDPQNGIRQFVAGTGGSLGGSEVQQAPGVEVVETGTSGVIKLDLSARSYSWRFVHIEGQTFTDSGEGSCH
ncbi:MAG TPA: metallophosphoesterase [Rubrobacter sp.]|nr:metallophosphoesterase [Rubrobacter sp.]